MWLMKRVAAVGAALLVLLPLAGCSLLFHQDDVAEDPMRELVGDLPSVLEVGSTAEGTFNALLWVSVSELDAGDLHTLVASAEEVLAGREATFKIALEDQVLLTIVFPHEFSIDELTTEVDYWLALSAANNAPLGILLQTSWHGNYRNIWDPDKTDAVDWEVLRAVPDPSTTFHSFNLDGIWADDAMPPSDVIALRDRLAAIELGDEESLALENFSPGYIEVRYQAPGAGGTDPTALPGWNRVRDAVSEVAAFRSPQANVVFQDTVDWAQTASLYLGACDVIADESRDEVSAQLVASLMSSGIEFPLGVASGFCNEPVGLTADGRLVDS
jgi:hypothetical protein